MRRTMLGAAAGAAARSAVGAVGSKAKAGLRRLRPEEAEAEKSSMRERMAAWLRTQRDSDAVWGDERSAKRAAAEQVIAADSALKKAQLEQRSSVRNALEAGCDATMLSFMLGISEKDVEALAYWPHKNRRQAEAAGGDTAGPQ